MYCGKLFKSLDRMLKERKSIDEIAEVLCDSVDDPRGKVIRLIKVHKGENWLEENADWLKYYSNHTKKSISSKKFDDASQKLPEVSEEPHNAAIKSADKLSEVSEETHHPTIKSTDELYDEKVRAYKRSKKILQRILSSLPEIQMEHLDELEAAIIMEKGNRLKPSNSAQPNQQTIEESIGDSLSITTPAEIAANEVDFDIFA